MMNTESVPVAASISSVVLPRLLRVHEGAATARITTTASATGIPTKIKRTSDAVTLPAYSPESQELLAALLARQERRMVMA